MIVPGLSLSLVQRGFLRGCVRMRLAWRGGLFGIGLDMSEAGATLNHAAFPGLPS